MVEARGIKQIIHDALICERKTLVGREAALAAQLKGGSGVELLELQQAFLTLDSTDPDFHKVLGRMAAKEKELLADIDRRLSMDYMAVLDEHTAVTLEIDSINFELALLALAIARGE